nr:class F sortase [Kribbella sandramycini]
MALALTGAYLQFDHPADATAPSPRPIVADSPTAPVPPRTVASAPARATPSPRLAAKPGRPVRLSVPRLLIDAAVVGITAERGTLVPPSNPRKLGWWSGGAQPGARVGSAVVTGHTVHSGGGAFDELGQLRPGDVIGVTTAQGRLGYRVAGVTTYRKQSFARNAERILDQTVPGRLVLITCEDWNGQVYLSNTVVIARRVA